MYKFQDLTPISGHFRTNFKISGQHPGLSVLKWLNVSNCLPHISAIITISHTIDEY